ncbi:PaaI family thioesterase [Bradyrhizobium diazoefficiens]|nr:PaaI family thioesterase [Bradyrhizobium diazoefficiens]
MPPGAQLLGREWLGFDESGCALSRFQAQLAFTNRHGTIQGGFLAAMLDSATGICALATLSPDLTVVTTGLDTRFLKPAGVVSQFEISAACRFL